MKVIHSRISRPIMPTQPVRNGVNNTVIISDNYLQILNRNSAIIRQFPFLALNIPKTKGCKCNAPAALRIATQRETERVRQSIADLSGEVLTAFKKALGASIIVVFARRNGAIQRLSI